MKKSSTNSETKQPRGGPTKRTPKLLARLILLARRGFTDVEMADLVGITRKTIHNWRASKEFANVFQSAKKSADLMVERSLFDRAIGYEVEEEQVHPVSGVPVKIKRRVLPDVTAQIFWLKNRDRANWNWDRIGQLDVNLRVIHPPDWNEFSRYFSVRDQAGSAVPPAPHPTNGHAVGAGADSH